MNEANKMTTCTRCHSTRVESKPSQHIIGLLHCRCLDCGNEFRELCVDRSEVVIVTESKDAESQPF